MPSSLIVVALVLAWLVVLVPMIVRKRQAIARTADSALAARVVHSGSGQEEVEMRDADELHDDLDVADPDREPYEDAFRSAYDDTYDDVYVPTYDHHDADPDELYLDEFELADVDRHPEPEPHRRPAHDGAVRRDYRPGRGGFNPEAAAVAARAKYVYRQRVVLAVIVGALATGVIAGVAVPMLWWAHGALDVTLIGYLAYLRRQVRIEEEIRERRLARMMAARRLETHRARTAARVEQRRAPQQQPRPEPEPVPEPEPEPRRERVADGPPTASPRVTHPGAVVVDVDDEDPHFDELDNPGSLPYRRAVGE